MGKDNSTIKNQPAGLRLQNVVKVFRSGKTTFTALRGLTLDIAPGEFVAITGPSGSGKTTLVHIMGGLSRPTKGVVTLDDQNIWSKNDAASSAYRNKHVGFVFQNYSLLPHYTALENVMVPLMVAAWPRAEQMRRAAICLKMVDLEKQLNQKASELSGGQRQRVGIARALAMSPGVLIADEPTGNLDTKHGQEVMYILQQLHKVKGITLVVVTHDPYIAAMAQRTVHIVDGRLQKEAQYASS